MQVKRRAPYQNKYRKIWLVWEGQRFYITESSYTKRFNSEYKNRSDIPKRQIYKYLHGNDPSFNVMFDQGVEQALYYLFDSSENQTIYMYSMAFLYYRFDHPNTLV